MAKYPRLLAMVASATVLALAGGVQASTLVTPPAVLSDNTTVFCMLVNAGTGPIQVTNTVHNTLGADISGRQDATARDLGSRFVPFQADVSDEAARRSAETATGRARSGHDQ